MSLAMAIGMLLLAALSLSLAVRCWLQAWRSLRPQMRLYGFGKGRGPVRLP